MSINPPNDRRTEPDNQLDHHALATRLEVDAATLDRFVRDHPNPTAPIVLGWAEAGPDHREAVERWLTVREDRAAATADELGEEVLDALESAEDELRTRGVHAFDEEVGGESAGGEA